MAVALGETPRGRLRAWLEDRINGNPAFVMKDLETEAKREFFSDAAWVDAMFGPMLGQQMRQIMANLRPSPKPRARDLIGRIEEFEQGWLEKKWRNWFESPDGPGYVCILNMTRPQLLEVAADRRRRSQAELKRAALCEAIAARMQSDDEQVEQRLSLKQLEALHCDINSEWEV